MMKPHTSSAALALGALALLVGAPVAAQDLPIVTPNDYDRFETLRSFDLNPTGTWQWHWVSLNDGSGELRVGRADGSGEIRTLEQGSRPAFSADGRWLAWSVDPTPEEREAADGPLPSHLGLLDLNAGVDTTLVPMRSFGFRDDGAWLAVVGAPVADSVGADLMVMRPGTDEMILVGNVDAFAWQDDGDLLAYTLKTAWGTTDGVEILDPDTGERRRIETADAEYGTPVWDDGSPRLAIYRSHEVEGMEEETHDILVWDDVTSGAAPQVLSAAGRAELGDTLRIVDYRGIAFHDEGRRIVLGVRPWSAEPLDEDIDEDADENDGEESTDAEMADDVESSTRPEVDPADVQVWHWDDDEIIRAQEWRATSIARRNHVAVWHRDEDRVVVLGTELEESVIVLEGALWGVAPDYSPYLFQRRFGSAAADWYRVDARSGARTLFAEGIEGFPSIHPDRADRLLLFDEGVFHLVDVTTLERTRLDPTGVADFHQSITDYDYPGPRPSFGVGGWSEDGTSAWLNDRMDVWHADLETGAVTRITDGVESGVRYRMMDVSPDATFGPAMIDDESELWFSLFHPDTKASGWARRDGDDLERLVFDDASLRSLTRAEDADVWAFRSERWDDSPDVFVARGVNDLDDATQVSETNPFLGEYAWGQSEILNYTTDAGHELQAILTYPADFEPGRQYPLILYQYEQLSDGLHTFDVPSERTYYDFQTWSQQGYFVLRPDILYEPGRPGPSALDAVNHALDAAIATGHVDPDGLGLIGHSWGGYQAAYLPTRTDRFAASVAGAAITDFISFMGSVHWNGGIPEVDHWETGQARMARPAWEDLEGHLESSPVNYIHELETPVLVMHGDEDGVVDFRQGLEYYNYARRAGKEVVMLVYPGADHGLSVEEQQIDYHRRILEWFDHYLRGADAPSWITEGETWVQRQERIGG